MGINIPTRQELIANTHESKDLSIQVGNTFCLLFLTNFLLNLIISGADSLYYLSVEGLVKAVQKDIKKDNPELGHCTACLTGNYPGGVPNKLDW